MENEQIEKFVSLSYSGAMNPLYIIKNKTRGRDLYISPPFTNKAIKPYFNGQRSMTRNRQLNP